MPLSIVILKYFVMLRSPLISNASVIGATICSGVKIRHKQRNPDTDLNIFGFPCSTDFGVHSIHRERKVNNVLMFPDMQGDLVCGQLRGVNGATPSE